MKKQPERTEMTRRILVDTFIRLSENKPADKITVSEICNKAGYNRSTFYQYFNDTFHLLSYIEDDFLNYIENTVVAQIGNIRPEQFFIDSFIQINADKKDILKLLFGKNSSFHAKLKRTLIPLFAKRMCMPAEDPETVYKLDFYLSGIISIFSRWVTSETPMAVEEYALLMKQIVEGMQKSELLPRL